MFVITPFKSSLLVHSVCVECCPFQVKFLHLKKRARFPLHDSLQSRHYIHTSINSMTRFNFKRFMTTKNISIYHLQERKPTHQS